MWLLEDVVMALEVVDIVVGVVAEEGLSLWSDRQKHIFHRKQC